MGRIGGKPITIPSGVEISLNATATGTQVKVKGAKGSLERVFLPEVKITKDGSNIVLTITSEDKKVKALHGTYRALIQNMVLGVTQGFEKRLTWTGVGYRMQPNGKGLKMQMGYSHDVDFPAVEGILFKIEDNQLVISGIDKALVGQTAADIRQVKLPEPYKGKGIRYVNEQIIRKAGKAAK